MSYNDFGSDPPFPGAVSPSRGGTHRLRFITLGKLLLVAESSGEEVTGSQRRKLALLAYLALARRPVQRDTLVEMFWGDEDEDRARHSLSNGLSYLRRILGPAAIAVRKSEISLAPNTPLTVDAVDLLAASAQMDHARVLDLYTGPFFAGVYITESESLDEWVAAERARIDGAFVKSCDAECMSAAQNRDWPRCTVVARRWLEVAPTSTEAALHLLNSLRAARTSEGRRAALDEYTRLQDLLRREYGMDPNARVTQLASQIAAKVEADHAAVTTESPEVDAGDHSGIIVSGNDGDTPADGIRLPPVHEHTPDAVSSTARAHLQTDESAVRSSQVAVRPRRTRQVQLLAAGAVIVALGATILISLAKRRTADTAPSGRPLIVVTDVANLRGDTASQWLEDGLSQMITAELGRSTDVEVVTPARVRDTRLRAELPLTGVLTPDAALDIARRLGATLVVRGGFTHGSGVYVLDVDVRDASTGRDLRSFTVRGADPMTLADQASGRILASSAGGAAGPRFAEIETANVAAYQHFVRALQAEAEGRLEDSRRELDEAIALDSGFASAIVMRAEFARDDADERTLARLRTAIRTARFTTRDVLGQEIDSAMHNGELTRAERLAKDMIDRYPHDPRSYSTLAALYDNRGDWSLSEATARRQLALDSLAEEAGDGPCVPCSAYQAIVSGRADHGDLTGAEEAARRWLMLQPDLPGAWAALAIPLAYAGRFDAALDADHRAELLSGNDPLYSMRIARDLILARRVDAADSLAHSWHADNPALHAGAIDIRLLVLRERGQMRESIRVFESDLASDPAVAGLVLEEVDAYGRVGDYAGAARVWDERVGHSAGARDAAHSLHGDAARWFTWSHAVEANSIAGGGDTVRLRGIADSMRVVGARSYYGRDWKLYNHVLGLIAMQGHRYAEAERDFSAARWGSGGWTETVAWLAKAQLAQHHPVAAIGALRDAYRGPLDAMGRYQPRSELDYLMALAFAQAGVGDSARIYGDYARSAWRDADPEIKRLLLALPASAPTHTSTERPMRPGTSRVLRLAWGNPQTRPVAH